MPEQEVARNLRTAAQKHYSFCTDTIIAALAIIPDEQTAIGLTVHPKYDSNRAHKARNAEKKHLRDREIMRWYLLGLSAAAIARRVYLKSLRGASFGEKTALSPRFFLESTQDSCEKTACMTPFSLEIHTTPTYQIHPKVRPAYNTIRKVIETYAENPSALFSEAALRKLRKQRIKA